ncbi:hypothetical protein [Litchfieldia alkalitelluris]|uniref:hypothetical protein n=1 Tax=Litchfieldia alkalitelluris TaxID=304268 RepID=UPI00099744F6|nr:hypothetical protein [Litchfieldia alkalitelluris]
MKKKLSDILAPMSFTEKISYLWEYYRIHFIASIVILIVLVTTISSIIEKKDIVLNIVVMGQMVDSEKLQSLQNSVNVELVNEEDRNSSEVSVRHIQYSSTQMDQQASVGLQKMAAEMSSKAIDIFVVDKALFEQINSQGQLLNLEDIQGVELSSIDESHLYLSAQQEGQVVGIDSTAMNIFSDVTTGGEFVLCIPANAQNMEKISQFFEVALK